MQFVAENFLFRIRVLYRAPPKNLETIMVSRFFVLFKSGVSLIFSLMKSPVRNRPDKLLHSLCAILFHLFRNMSVNIQRERRSGMAEIFLHGFNVVAAFDTGNCICVAQVVKAGGWRTDSLYNSLEAVVHRAIG